VQDAQGHNTGGAAGDRQALAMTFAMRRRLLNLTNFWLDTAGLFPHLLWQRFFDSLSPTSRDRNTRLAFTWFERILYCVLVYPIFISTPPPPRRTLIDRLRFSLSRHIFASNFGIQESYPTTSFPPSRCNFEPAYSTPYAEQESRVAHLHLLCFHEAAGVGVAREEQFDFGRERYNNITTFLRTAKGRIGDLFTEKKTILHQ
jgi:hypothetical protein